MFSYLEILLSNGIYSVYSLGKVGRKMAYQNLCGYVVTTCYTFSFLSRRLRVFKLARASLPGGRDRIARRGEGSGTLVYGSFNKF